MFFVESNFGGGAHEQEKNPGERASEAEVQVLIFPVRSASTYQGMTLPTTNHKKKSARYFSSLSAYVFDLRKV